MFRLAAVLMGFSVFVVAELVCVLFDWGRPTRFDDPFAGFSEIHPLFELDESATNYRIAPSRLTFFAEDSFPARKGERTFRIFCLGGSTVQGRPYSTPTSFPTSLEIGLRAADDRFDWQVVNCGGISYASYRLVPILEECLQYEPDYIILCTGHNEFLEDRSYDHIKNAPAIVKVPLRLANRWRSFNLVRHGWRRITGTAGQGPPQDRPVLAGEADAILDHNDSLNAYQRDVQWHTGVMAHFEFNLRRMAQLADEAGVPFLMILPPSNLGDTPPFKSEHRSDLTAEQRKQWADLVSRYRALRGAEQESVALLKQALHIDDLYAATWFELGKCYSAHGMYDQARPAYVKARDLDVCPLRMLSPMEAIIRRVAEEEGVPLIDAHALLEGRTPHGILDGKYLVDHVHPSFEGHQIIAREIIHNWIQTGLVRPCPDWKEDFDRANAAHFAALGDFYFLRGQRTLEALRAWTQGNADGPAGR